MSLIVKNLHTERTKHVYDNVAGRRTGIELTFDIYESHVIHVVSLKIYWNKKITIVYMAPIW